MYNHNILRFDSRRTFAAMGFSFSTSFRLPDEVRLPEVLRKQISVILVLTIIAVVYGVRAQLPPDNSRRSR